MIPLPVAIGVGALAGALVGGLVGTLLAATTTSNGDSVSGRLHPQRDVREEAAGIRALKRAKREAAAAGRAARKADAAAVKGDALRSERHEREAVRRFDAAVAALKEHDAYVVSIVEHLTDLSATDLMQRHTDSVRRLFEQRDGDPAMRIVKIHEDAARRAAGIAPAKQVLHGPVDHDVASVVVDLGERLISLASTVERIDTRLNREMDECNIAFTGIDERIDAVDSRLAAAEKRLAMPLGSAQNGDALLQQVIDKADEMLATAPASRNGGKGRRNAPKPIVIAGTGKR